MQISHTIVFWSLSEFDRHTDYYSSLLYIQLKVTHIKQHIAV